MQPPPLLPSYTKSQTRPRNAPSQRRCQALAYVVMKLGTRHAGKNMAKQVWPWHPGPGVGRRGGVRFGRRGEDVALSQILVLVEVGLPVEAAGVGGAGCVSE